MYKYKTGEEPILYDFVEYAQGERTGIVNKVVSDGKYIAVGISILGEALLVRVETASAKLIQRCTKEELE